MEKGSMHVKRNTKCLERFAAACMMLWGIVSSDLHAQEIIWHSFEDAVALAETSGHPVLVDIWAPWCGWCHKMKQSVYPALPAELTKKLVFTRINRDDRESTHRYQGQRFTSMRLAQELRAESVPTVVLLSSDGDYLLHLSGFVEADTLRPVLEYVAGGAYQELSFEAFQKETES